MTRAEFVRGVLLGIGVAAVVSLLGVLNARSASQPGSADTGSGLPSSVDWTKVRVEPDHAHILMTRLFPFGLTPCSCPEGIGISAAITLRPDNPSAFQAALKTVRGRFLATSALASDRGATLRIALSKQLTRGEEGQFRAIITASHVGIAMDPLDYTPSGTYDGTLSIGPTKKNSLAVPVTVTVQDLFVWPLFAVLVGALGAWWLIRWHDETRQKKLIKVEIAEAAER